MVEIVTDPTKKGMKFGHELNHLSNEENPSCLGCESGVMLPSYMGITLQ